MHKKLIAGAGTGLMAGMLLMGTANTAFAETDYQAPYSQQTNATGMHIMHRWNSGTKAASLATSLGLDPVQVKQEMASGKSLKQILADNGIVPGQIQRAFEKTRKIRNNRKW